MRLNALAYYADFFIAALVIAALAGHALIAGTSTDLSCVTAAALAGFACWTLLEYFVHRTLYHNVPYFIELHDAHHDAPNSFIGAPPVIGIVLILMLSYAPWVSLNLWLAHGLSIGMLAGYMGYMTLHHAAHHWNVASGSWLYQARRHHALHHHHHLEGNYGITTALWDHVFGTALETRRTGRRTKPG